MFLKRDSAAGMLAWVIQSSGKSVLADRQCGFCKDLTPLFNGILNICSHRKIILTRKTYKRYYALILIN